MCILSVHSAAPKTSQPCPHLLSTQRTESFSLFTPCPWLLKMHFKSLRSSVFLWNIDSSWPFRAPRLTCYLTQKHVTVLGGCPAAAEPPSEAESRLKKRKQCPARRPLHVFLWFSSPSSQPSFSIMQQSLSQTYKTLEQAPILEWWNRVLVFTFSWHAG